MPMIGHQHIAAEERFEVEARISYRLNQESVGVKSKSYDPGWEVGKDSGKGSLGERGTPAQRNATSGMVKVGTASKTLSVNIRSGSLE